MEIRSIGPFLDYCIDKAVRESAGRVNAAGEHRKHNA